MIPSLALLAACHHGGGDTGPTTATQTHGGWAGSSPDAPWSFHVNTALWATTSRGDIAYLLLSDGTPTCDDVLAVYDQDFFSSLSPDSGLFLVPERSGVPGGEPFDGLYMAYGATSGEEQSYSLTGGAFNDGVFWSLGYYGAGMWLRVDQDTAAGVSGEFYAVWWSGTFQAENCGEVDEPNNTYYRESGYGYDYGTDYAYTDYGGYYYYGSYGSY